MSSLPVDGRWQQLTLGLFRQSPASFATFLAGTNGEALRAVAAWATLPDTPWCLFLWGPAGVGKSHLVQAALSAVDQRGASCIYLPLREARLHSAELLEGLDSLSAVGLDDLDAIAGDPVWEEAVFTLYNALQATGGRLIVTADCSPQTLALRLPDLRSRLSASLVYHLENLNDEDKAQALIGAAARRGIALPEAVARYLLRRLPRDWAGLHAALDRLDEASLSAGRPLTVPFAREVLGLPD